MVSRVERGQLVLEGIPEDVLGGSMDRLLQYQNTRGASVVDFAHEGQGLFIRTRFAETAQLHHVSFAGGARSQMTFFSDPVASASVCPAPGSESILFTKDSGGNEFYQIYNFNTRTSEWKMLTDGKSKNAAVLWSPQGDWCVSGVFLFVCVCESFFPACVGYLKNDLFLLVLSVSVIVWILSRNVGNC